MLPFDDIRKLLYYYALKFTDKRFETDELVNEAWIKIHTLTIPQFASNGIRWAMQTYKQLEYARDHHRHTGATVTPYSQLSDESLLQHVAVYHDTSYHDIDNKEFVDYILHNSNLSLSDLLIVDMRFRRHMTLREIAKHYGCSYEWIRQRIGNVIKKVRLRNGRLIHTAPTINSSSRDSNRSVCIYSNKSSARRV